MNLCPVLFFKLKEAMDVAELLILVWTDRLQVPVNNMFCSMPAEAGPCRAAFPRWYWNASSKKCENFIYGGCEGNANNFGTERECQDAAGKWCQSVAPAPEGIVAYSSYHPLNPVVTVLLSLCFAILLLSSGGQCLLL